MIDVTSTVSREARIGPNVHIGSFSVIHANSDVGAGSEIGSHCVIGHPSPDGAGDRVIIGRDSVIRSHSVLYEGSALGDRLETGHHVVIREGTQAGVNLRVGTGSDLQGDSTIGDYVRIHSRVFLAKLSTVESFAWLMPGVCLLNDPHPPSDDELFEGAHVERFAVIASGATIMPGVRVGENAVIGAGSLVTRNVAAGALAVGSPAQAIGPASEVTLRGSSAPAYPWRGRFTRGYPPGALE